MNKKFGSVLSALTLTLCLFHFSLLAQENSEINQLLETKKDDFRGHVIMVVKQKDSTLYQHQIGLENLDTKIPVASASKWLSAAVILTLVDQELLSLDDSIGKYLPVFQNMVKGILLFVNASHIPVDFHPMQDLIIMTSGSLSS